MKLPSSQDLLSTYLVQVVVSAVVAVLLWMLAPTINDVCSMLALYIEILTYAILGMLISYAVVVVVSSDSLVQKMSQTGLFSSLSDVLGYAMFISLGSLLLNIVFFYNYANWWGGSALDFLNSILFLFLLFVANLALLFFMTVVSKLTQISKLRTM